MLSVSLSDWPSPSWELSWAPDCSPPSSPSSSCGSGSASTSASARSSAARRRRAARVKVTWSSCAAAMSASAWSAPAPSVSRQRSSTWRAASGAGSPDIFSRASKREGGGDRQLVLPRHPVEAFGLAFLAEPRAQIGGDAGHVAGADHLDAGLLERVVDVLGLARAGAAGGVDGVVMVAEAERDAVGGAAQPRHLGGRQGAGRQRQAGALADQAGGAGLERDLHLGLLAIARSTPAVARLNSSDRVLSLPAASAHRAAAQMRLPRADAGRDVLVEAALVVLGDRPALGLVAFVEEGHAEGEADIAEDAGVLGPGDHRAGRHHGRDVAVDEARARQVGERHHALDPLLHRAVAGIDAELRQHDGGFLPVRQVVERGDDVPAIHLSLIDLLGAVIEPGGVAEPDRVGGREQAERGVRADHPVLVEQGELALDLEHALDHEHHVRPAGVVFVEAERAGVLQRPGQDALAELGDLLAVLQDDRVLADQVDAADVAVEIDADAGPVEACRDLLDMRRLAGAVIALDHHPAVEGEAGEDRERGLAVEAVGRIEIGHVLRAHREGRDLERRIDVEDLAHVHLGVGHVDRRGGRRAGFGEGGNLVHQPKCPVVSGRQSKPGVRIRKMSSRPASEAVSRWRRGPDHPRGRGAGSRRPG